MSHAPSDKPLRLLLAGSGMAGPVVPLLAIVQELHRRELPFEALFLGTAMGPEQTLVEHAGIPFRVFPSGKFRRYASLRNVTDFFRIAWAFFCALASIARYDPDVFISAGGFIAPPVAWAARTLGVPVLIHQQDVEPLLANRLMVRAASRITVTFESSLSAFPAGKTVWTGNPVREQLTGANPASARKRFGFGLSKPTVLIMGGGTGAQALNEAACAALPRLLPVCNVLHLSGDGKDVTPCLEAVVRQYPDLSGYRLLPFLHEMEDAYAIADVVVCRAGFSTLTELAFLKKAAIVVPLPHSPQEANAQVFAQRHALQVLPQQELSGERLAEAVLQLLGNDAARKEMAEHLGKSMKVGATALLTDEVLALTRSS